MAQHITVFFLIHAGSVYTMALIYFTLVLLSTHIKKGGNLVGKQPKLASDIEFKRRTTCRAP
jgi:hypothetical protein